MFRDKDTVIDTFMLTRPTIAFH